jgi:hypothetical protein
MNEYVYLRTLCFQTTNFETSTAACEVMDVSCVQCYVRGRRLCHGLSCLAVCLVPGCQSGPSAARASASFSWVLFRVSLCLQDASLLADSSFVKAVDGVNSELRLLRLRISMQISPALRASL